jgi:hypothetical protein
MLINPVLLLKVQCFYGCRSTAIYIAYRLSCEWLLIITDLIKPVLLIIYNIFDLKAVHLYERFRTFR